MKKYDHLTEHAERFETQKTNLDKLAYVFFRYVYLKNQFNSKLSMINSGVKRSKKYVRKPLKSLRTYIKQNRNMARTMFFAYLVTMFALILGVLLSTSLFDKHSKIKNQNQTEKKRFIIRISYRIQ